MQGAQCGIWSRDSRITPWAKDRRLTAEPPRCPLALDARLTPVSHLHWVEHVCVWGGDRMEAGQKNLTSWPTWSQPDLAGGSNRSMDGITTVRHLCSINQNNAYIRVVISLTKSNEFRARNQQYFTTTYKRICTFYMNVTHSIESVCTYKYDLGYGIKYLNWCALMKANDEQKNGALKDVLC